MPLEACTDSGEVLGIIAYTGAHPAPLPAGLPALAVPAAMLWPARPVALVLRGGAAAGGHHGRVQFRHDGEHLFGVIELAEPPGAGLDAHLATPLQQLAEAAYRELFGTLDALGYPALLRVWNYLGAINLESHGLERYRQFNIGRQHAFAAAARAFTGEVPAACALGTPAGPLQVAFLAGREPARPVENPRQTSAYHYPAEYGPRSPTFSRAALTGSPDAPLLFVSGTASIVGHRSLHLGDVAAQTRESLANIAAVVAEAGRLAGGGKLPALDALFYTVYVRHAGDLAAVQAEFADILPGARVIFMQADICRSNLLVEIEASGGHPPEIPQ
ncbi:MAG: hypothetical protein HGA47_09050 [Zoogloea sp.]|nr:hypothetical protein [Zoogloea sp.]